MKGLLIAMLAAAVLSLFGSSALQAADGDVWPGGNGSLQIYVGDGDVWPGGNG